MPLTMESSADATAIRPFTIEVPEADLEDLRARIAATRWPTKELVEDRSQGVQLATITTVAVFRCVSALSLSVMRGAGVWLPCVTSFPGRGGYPGPVPAMSRAL